MIGASEAGVGALAPRLMAPLGVGTAQVALAGPVFRDLIFDRIIEAESGRDPIFNALRRFLRIEIPEEGSVESLARDLDVTVGGGDVLREQMRRAIERRQPPTT